MSKSISSAIAFLVLLLLLTSPASTSASPLSRRLMGSRITIPDHSTQVGFRFLGGRKVLSVVHTDDYNPPGASDKHNPSTGS